MVIEDESPGQSVADNVSGPRHSWRSGGAWAGVGVSAAR